MRLICSWRTTDGVLWCWMWWPIHHVTLLFSLTWTQCSVFSSQCSQQGEWNNTKTLFKASYCRAFFFLFQVMWWWGKMNMCRCKVTHNDHINDQISESLETFEVKVVVQKKKNHIYIKRVLHSLTDWKYHCWYAQLLCDDRCTQVSRTIQRAVNHLGYSKKNWVCVLGGTRCFWATRV